MTCALALLRVQAFEPAQVTVASGLVAFEETLDATLALLATRCLHFRRRARSLSLHVCNSMLYVRHEVLLIRIASCTAEAGKVTAGVTRVLKLLGHGSLHMQTMTGCLRSVVRARPRT
jgi:hypothetical protein